MARPVVLCLRQRSDAQIERLLSVLGASLDFCATGREAIAIAGAGPLTCVISPLCLPDMRAELLIDELRRVAPGLAVVVIVDDPGVNEAVEVMRHGAHAVIDSGTLHSGLLQQVAPLVNGR